jgi:hypothetical protein
MPFTAWSFLPFVILIIAITATIICYKAKSISNNILYNYGFWSFWLFSISLLISIINAYVFTNLLPIDFLRQVSLRINYVIWILMHAGFIVLVFGFYKSLKATKNN